MNFKPLFDRVMLLPEVTESKTKSGIYLPNKSEEKTQVGKVVAVGTGGYIDGEKQEMFVKCGQRVLFSIYAGTSLSLDNVNYLVIRQQDILGIIGD